MDLTTVPPVDESDNVTQMLVTLTDSSNVADADFDGRGNAIMGGVSDVLNGLSKHSVNSSVFKMIITPTNDPTVFNALIWGGRDQTGAGGPGVQRGRHLLPVQLPGGRV